MPIKKIIDNICKQYSLTDSLQKEVMSEIDSCLQIVDIKSEKLEWVSLRDIIYVDRDGKQSLFHTFENSYKHCIGYDALVELASRYDFWEVDNRMLANMSLARKYDSEYGKLFFTSEVEKDSKYVTLARRCIPKIVNRLGKENDLHQKECIKQKGLKDMKNTLFGTL